MQLGEHALLKRYALLAALLLAALLLSTLLLFTLPATSAAQ